MATTRTSAEGAVLSKPVEKPSRKVVAAPVWLASAISRTGLNRYEVKKSATRSITTTTTTPTIALANRYHEIDSPSKREYPRKRSITTVMTAAIISDVFSAAIGLALIERRM